MSGVHDHDWEMVLEPDPRIPHWGTLNIANSGIWYCRRCRYQTTRLRSDPLSGPKMPSDPNTTPPGFSRLPSCAEMLMEAALR